MRQTTLKVDVPSGGDKLVTERVASQEILEGTAGAPSHAIDHITSGSDEIDGDKLDIDWSPSNYTPSTSPAEADSLDNLTAHLYGIDQELTVTQSHASTHLSGGSDQIDGDQLDIDWNPSGYTPATTPTEVTSIDHLTAHLYGISEALQDKLNENGTVALAANWDIGDGRVIFADKIRARDGDGLALYEDGDAGIFIEDGGQVGIGTSSPVRILHVGSGGLSPINSADGIYCNPNVTTAQITVENSSSIEGGINAHNDSTFRMGAWSNHSLVFVQNNSAMLTLSGDGLTATPGKYFAGDDVRARSSSGLSINDDGGNLGIFVEDGGQVGIGTSSPVRALHVGGGSQSPTNTMEGIYCNPNFTTAQITVENSNGVEGGLNPHNDNKFYMGTWSNHPLEMTTNNSSRLTILTDGKVGIGTSAPTQVLEVNGNAQADNMLIGDWPAAAGFAFLGNDTLTQTSAANYALLQQDTTGTTFINSPDEIFISIANTVAMNVDPSSDVGIGTSSAAGQLHIDQSSASGAQPVLYLDQADVSEEFIRFQATAGDSNAVSTKIVGSHYGRVRVNVNGTDMWMPVFNDDTTSDWIGVTFATGWGNLSGAQAVEYRKIGDIVYLRGTAERTSGSGTTIFTLPSGYRPPAQLRFANRSRWSNAIGELPSRMTISTAGVVSMTGSIVNSENWLSHDGFNFSVT